MLEFYSIDSEDNEVHYLSVYEKHNDTFIFDDKTAENTKVFFTVFSEFRIKRVGNISMDFPFVLNELTFGKYENNMGLSVVFGIKTKQIICRDNEYFISYELYLDGDKISEHNIKIKIIV